MERIELLKKKYKSMCRAHIRFIEAVERMHRFNDPIDEFYTPMRDSALKAFEFNIDPFWKFLKFYMIEKYAAEAEEPGPRAVYRLAEKFNIMSLQEANTFIAMVVDRNQVAHDYDELVIEEIKDRLPEYCEIIGLVLKRIKL